MSLRVSLSIFSGLIFVVWLLVLLVIGWLDFDLVVLFGCCLSWFVLMYLWVWFALTLCCSFVSFGLQVLVDFVLFVLFVSCLFVIDLFILIVLVCLIWCLMVWFDFTLRFFVFAFVWLVLFWVWVWLFWFRSIMGSDYFDC